MFARTLGGGALVLGVVLSGFACCRSYSDVPNRGPAASGEAGAADAGAKSGGAMSGGGTSGGRNVGGGGNHVGGSATGLAGDAPTPGGGNGGSEPSAGGAGAAGEAGSSGQGGGGEGGIATDGLQLWLRADAGVTLDGNHVVKWEDQTSNHLDATQAVALSQPVLANLAIGEKPAVLFDGTDDWLQLPTLDLDYTEGFSSFMVVERLPSSNACDAFFEASTSKEVNDISLGMYENAFHFEVQDQYEKERLVAFVNGTPLILDAIDSPLGNSALRDNGQEVGAGVMMLPVKTPRAQVFLGRSLYVDCSYLHGAIGEILLYNRALSVSERDEIEAYLAARWGAKL